MHSQFTSRPVFLSGSRASALALLLAAGCASDVEQREEISAQTDAVVQGGVEGLDLQANGPHAVVEGEYSVPAAVDTRVVAHTVNGQPVKTDVRGKLYLPQGEAGAFGTGPYPVAVLLHGNHSTCHRPSTTSAPDDQQNTEFTYSGTCPAGHVEVPSYLGYEYIARHLASLGYAVASINANRGINGGGGPQGDSGLIAARGELVLKHLTLLRSWDQGAALPAGAALGVTLGNVLDFSHVGLMGHSMGGEGVRAAYERLTQPPVGSYGNDATGIHVDGVFEFAPSDLNLPGSGQWWEQVQLDAPGAHWAVMLGSCDHEVQGLPATGVFTRRRLRGATMPKVISSVFTVPGANHAYFNQQWTLVDGVASTCPAGQDYLWNPEFATNPALIFSTRGSERQRNIGLMVMSAFFRGFVGTFPQANVYQKVFDSQQKLPASLAALTQPSRETEWHGRAEVVSGTASSQSTVGSNYEEYVNGITLPGKRRKLADITWSAPSTSNRYDLVLWNNGRSLADQWALSASVARYHAIASGAVPADAYADQPLDVGVRLLTTTGVSQEVRSTNYGAVRNRVNELTPCDTRWTGDTLPLACMTTDGTRVTPASCLSPDVFVAANDGSGLGTCYHHTRQSRALVFQEMVLTLHDFALPAGTLVKGLRLTFNGTPSGHVLLDRSVLLRQRIKGDANGDGIVTIVDALMTAQYYTGLAPAPFFPDAADVNCSGVTDIVDALMISQYYVGQLAAFPCGQ